MARVSTSMRIKLEHSAGAVESAGASAESDPRSSGKAPLRGA
jgi:hypothetical protein